MAPTDNQKVVIFVHGTKLPFLGGDAPFMKPESDLRKRFDQYGEQIIHREFYWSGGNSHKARIKAAEELAKCIKESIASHPDAAIYIISHSHGGNVALYSSKLLTEKENEHIKGVLCMATPFITCKPRETIENLHYTASLISLFPSYLAISIIFIIWVLILTFTLNKFFPSVKGGLLLLAIAFLVDIPRFYSWYLLYKYLQRRVESLLKAWAEKRQANSSASLSLPDKVPFTVFNASPIFDEPTIVLKFWRTLGNLPYYVWRPAWIYTFFILSLPLTILIAISSRFISPFYFDGSVALLIASGASVVLTMFLCTISLILFLLSILVMPIARIHPFGFGAESPLDSWFMDVSVEKSPCFEENVVDRRYSIDGLLQHSGIYVDKKFLSDLQSMAEDLMGGNKP